jgi:hypothetical protein
MFYPHQIKVFFMLGFLFFLSNHAFASPPKSAGLETEFAITPSLLVDKSSSSKEYQLATPSLSLRPVVEWSLSKIFYVGAEWGFLWQDASVKQLGDPSEKRLLMLPHARIRLDFPISCRLIFEAVFAMGPNFWTKWRGAEKPIGDRMVGLGYRFSAGFRFVLNTQVDLLMGVGYQQEYAYGTYDLQLTQIPAQIGLRAQF